MIILWDEELLFSKLRFLDDRLAEIPLDEKVDLSEQEKSDLSEFYLSTTLRQISSLRHSLLDREKSNRLDLIDQWIEVATTNRLTGHSQVYFLLTLCLQIKPAQQLDSVK